MNTSSPPTQFVHETFSHHRQHAPLPSGRCNNYQVWNNGLLEWSAFDDAVGWRLHHSPTLDSNSWQEATGMTFVNGTVRFTPDHNSRASFYRLQRPPRK